MYIAGSTIEPLTSTGTCLTFRYRSNATNQARGWQGIFSCVDTPPAVIQYAMSSGIRYVCNGILRDPGGTGNYPAGIWEQTFTSYNGERLRAVINGINVNGNNGGHWIRVYDGPSTASPLIGSYNNFNGWPPALQSTGSSLTFRFESTNSNAGLTAGFEFEFSCFSALPIDVAWLSSPVCRGAQLNIPFTLNATVNAGNVFTAQLSDASGNFGSPVNIGTLTGTAAGTINATIPIGTPAGSGYRVRILSSDPVQIGNISPNNLIINPTPNQPGAISNSNGLSFCAGSSTVLSINPQSGVSYQWLRDGLEVGSNSNQLTATEAGVYTIRLENGCGSVESTNSVSLSLLPSPAAAVISGQSAVTICDGVSYQLNITPQAGIIYSWTRNNIAIGTNTASISVNEAGIYAVSVSNTCGSAASVNSIDISVEDSPSITLISSTPVGCSGEANGAIDVSIAGASVQSWSNGTSTEDLTGIPAGDYILTATSNGGCSAELTVSLINPAPLVIEAEVSPQVGSTPNGSIDVTITGGLPPFEVSWSNGAFVQDLIDLEADTYTITVEDANGCVQTAEYVVDIVTSVSNPNQSMVMYPNPADDYVTISMNEASGWKLFDASGRLVDVGYSAFGSNTIDVSKFDNGLYTLSFDLPQLKAVKLMVVH
jgi:hypothetical protein